MELKSNDIKKMSTKEIFKEILPSLMSIYNSIKYLEISKEEFFEIVLKEIHITKNDYNSRMSYSEFIKRRVKLLIIERERNLTHDSKETLRILNNYVNIYLNDLTKFDSLINAFKKIDRLISLYDCELDTNIIADLLKNSAFNNLIKNIVNSLLPNLSYKKIEKIYNNNFFISTIEVYSVINNIEIKKISDNDEYDFSFSDDIDIYLNEISSKKVLTLKEEKELFKRYQNGDTEAKNELIECSLKLAASYASKVYNKNYGNSGLSIQDLIQEANLGIMKALDKFDPDKGYRFSTYAYDWIRQSITRAKMNQGRTVRIPVYWQTGLNTFIENVNSLANELGREPTFEEIKERFNIPLKRIIKYHELMMEEKSLNELASDDSTKEIEEFYVHSINEVEERVIKLQLKEDIKKVFEMINFTPRELDVLKLRFGFYDNELYLLQAIADKYGVTGESIRQTELRALNKIRTNYEATSILAEYTKNPEKNKKIKARVFSYRSDLDKRKND